MLDDEGNSTSHSARSSFEGRGNDDDDESRDLLKSWGLEVQGGGASASSSSTSASSSVDAFESWPATKRSGASTSTTTQQRKEGNPIPRLSSTVTNSTSGTTASPLLIFTGSPNPSPSLSSTTSPRAFSPSPNRSPSPSHTAYNLPSSRSSTPSRITSQPMDRTGSSSKSRDIHGRQKSLTSACPPVTSSYSAEGGGGFAAGAYPPTSPQRGWKVYDWGMGRDKHGYSSDDEDPRSGAKGTAAGQQQSALGSLLALPSALLGFFLAPLSSPSSSSTSSHSSPSLNGSASPKGGASSANGSSSNSSKRQPLPVRLLLLAYLIFSALFFGLHLSSWAAGNEPNGAGAASKYLLVARGAEGGVGGVAAQWAQKVAEGVRWKGSSVGEMEVDEGGLDVRALGDERVEEWGLVRRLGVQSESDWWE